jgi:hypothetical protein
VLENNATFCGVIAGKTVLLENNVVVDQHDDFVIPPHLNPWPDEEEEGGEETKEEAAAAPPTFTPQFYIECSEPEGFTPGAYC